MAKREVLRVRDLVFEVYDSGAVDVKRSGVMVLHVQAEELDAVRWVFEEAYQTAWDWGARRTARAEAEIARIRRDADEQIATLLASVPK